MLLCRIDWHHGSEQLQSPTTLLKAKRVARKLFKGSWVPLGENKIESFTMASHMGTLSLGHMIPDNLNNTTIAWRVSLQVMDLVHVWVQVAEDTCCSINPLSTLVSWDSTHLFDWPRHFASGHFNKMLQTTHSSPNFWKEQLKIFMYDGQCEHVMGENLIVCTACLFV